MTKTQQPTLAQTVPVQTALDKSALEQEVKSRIKNDGWNSVTILAPGEPLPACRPGDFLLVRGTSPLSRLIRFGERFRHSRAAAQWSHAALIAGQGTLVEALARGIRHSSADKYDNRWRALVRVAGSSEARANAMRYADSCVGQRYGFVDFASVALSQLLGFGLVLTTAHSQICSEFVAHSLERLGYIFAKTAELTSPADLYQQYGGERCHKGTCPTPSA